MIYQNKKTMFVALFAGLLLAFSPALSGTARAEKVPEIKEKLKKAKEELAQAKKAFREAKKKVRKLKKKLRRKRLRVVKKGKKILVFRGKKKSVIKLVKREKRPSGLFVQVKVGKNILSLEAEGPEVTVTIKDKSLKLHIKEDMVQVGDVACTGEAKDCIFKEIKKGLALNKVQYQALVGVAAQEMKDYKYGDQLEEIMDEAGEASDGAR